MYTYSQKISIFAHYRCNINVHEECPLGNDFFPSLITTGSPVHLNVGFTCPSGKHRQKKSGLGRPEKIDGFNINKNTNLWNLFKRLDNIPTTSFKISVIRPLNPRANVTDNTDC